MGVEINYLQKRQFLLTTHASAEENLLHFSANIGVNGNLFTNRMNPKGSLVNRFWPRGAPGKWAVGRGVSIREIVVLMGRERLVAHGEDKR